MFPFWEDLFAREKDSILYNSKKNTPANNFVQENLGDKISNLFLSCWATYSISANGG
jgi:hypothetical protein